MGTRIRGILTTVPPDRRSVEDLAGRFGAAEAERTAQVTGVREARVIGAGATAADLAQGAASKLLARLGLPARDVDGVILVTQTPDFVFPATACVLQDRLGLPKRSLAFDVNLGCSAYPYGLAIAQGLIASRLSRCLLLLVADTISLAADPNHLGTVALFGDAAVATLLEHDADDDDLMAFDLGTDGAGWTNLILPVGQRRWRTVEAFRAAGPEKLRSLDRPDCLHMDGAQIFAFTLREVPGIVSRTLAAASRTAESVDYFFFHQANQFILDHLVRKIGLAPGKCPLSIGVYGNSSGASPAVTACHAVAAENQNRELSAMFIGFGVGYSWGGALVRLRPGTLYPVETVEP